MRTVQAVRRKGRRPGTSTLVACVGDSITRGQISANYVTKLGERLGLRGYEFFNAGVNGNLAWNVAERLDEVPACDPDVVTLLIGSNDVIATASPAHLARYRRYQRLPQTPTLTWYRDSVERILDRLSAETRARVAVLEIPPLGENLDSELNRRIDAYNAALHELCEARGIACLPLHQRLVALLPPDHRAPPWTGSTRPMWGAAARYFLLRQDWQRISAAYGLMLLTDHVHLNDRAASIIADLIEEYLTTAQPRREAASQAPAPD